MDMDTEQVGTVIMRKNKTSKNHNIKAGFYWAFSFYNPFIFISFAKNFKV